MRGRAVVLEPDRVCRAHLTALLGEAGYEVTVARDESAALAAASRGADLVVTELSLHARSTLGLCTQLRADPRLAVIAVSARPGEELWVAALEAGVDDVVGKPWADREMLLRVASVVRRRSVAAAPLTVASTEAGVLELEPVGRVARLDGRWIPLSAPQYALLDALVRVAGRVVSRSELLGRLRRHGSEPRDESLEAHVRALRARLEADPRRPCLILTVRALGYRLAVQPVPSGPGAGQPGGVA